MLISACMLFDIVEFGHFSDSARLKTQLAVLVVAAIIYGGGQEKFLVAALLVAIIGVGNAIGAKGDTILGVV